VSMTFDAMLKDVSRDSREGFLVMDERECWL
jgi:hypothetical protein